MHASKLRHILFIKLNDPTFLPRKERIISTKWPCLCIYYINKFTNVISNVELRRQLLYYLSRSNKILIVFIGGQNKNDQKNIESEDLHKSIMVMNIMQLPLKKRKETLDKSWFEERNGGAKG